jgi:hypothetical protein
MRVKAEVAAGQSVLIQETWDPAWRAYVGGKHVPIRRDPVMHFMLVDTGPGTHELEVRFETPLENRVGQVLMVLSLGLVGWLLTRRDSSHAKNS